MITLGNSNINEEFINVELKTSQINNDSKHHKGFVCLKCHVSFPSESSLKMHNNIHGVSFKCLTETELVLRRDLLYEEVIKQQEDEERAKVSTTGHKPRRIYKPKSKRIGLTKIKMEDCLRCDACSCIYIDPQDYYKHMRNFHQKFNTVIPRSRRKMCEPITFYSNSLEQVNYLQEVKQEKDELCHTSNENNIRDAIKTRWSKVVLDRLSVPVIPVQIKEEPIDDDCSYLLSNVEVKIKTEPVDF